MPEDELNQAIEDVTNSLLTATPRLERARAAKQLQDWDVAIALVGAHAECFSDDPDMHDNHVWHIDLLARAERGGVWRRRRVTAPKMATVAPCTCLFD
jgi:hypothetical protein